MKAINQFKAPADLGHTRGDECQAAAQGGTTNVIDPLRALEACAIEVSLAAAPSRIDQAPRTVSKFSLRICMCGPTLSGKSEQAIRLAERYRLKVGWLCCLKERW